MCAFCGGSLIQSTTEYMDKEGNLIIVIKNIPCEKCNQCGEPYFSSSVMQQIECILDCVKIISSEISVTVIDYTNKVA